jgi:hypothetical protein
MDKAADLNDLKTRLRDELCGECPGRSEGDAPAPAESQPPPAAAQCESDCALFVNLPRLARVAKEGEPPCGYEVFSKSLDHASGNVRNNEVARALTVLESAAVHPTHPDAPRPPVPPNE